MNPFHTARPPSHPSLLRCAEAGDRLLARHDIELTMGGEPTFLPRDPHGAEWNTAALGPEKLPYARQLARTLIDQYCPGGLPLFTYGKQYPGEPLPRWTLRIIWDTDPGHPFWQDPTLLASEETTQSPGLKPAKVMEKLARELGLAKYVVPFSEPDAKTPSAWVLPLDQVEGEWVSAHWWSASECPPLIPGDSLPGLRLPLGKLPEDTLKRALVVAEVDQQMVFFLPPLWEASFRELLRVIENLTRQNKVGPIRLAGYPPEGCGPTVREIGLASDPGVLEINTAPCADWNAYQEQIQALYKAAHKVKLVARKNQFNGQVCGTGGGAHFCFGGPDPERSPFFQNPDLLPRIIRYWQRHPSLSYAFTGMFLGPGSQAPRIDETSVQTLYELEIANAGAAQLGSPQNRYLYDLLFRDLLMDRHGNAHRAEISVDKLHNPHAPNGKLGIIEFRAFESQPSAGVLSRIALFLRSLIAMLAAQPYEKPFRRWGGELHDRFFLPSFLWEDLEGICQDLRAAGIPFRTSWLSEALQFRFPELGRLQVGNQTVLTLHQALESWPLLGEQSHGSTTSRSVDASTDRIEVRLTDPALREEGILLVNGLPAPFGTSKQFAAAGIRYKAFYLHPSLHPHIPVHSPLLIEWVDRTHLTVLAAARYHNWNPANQTYARRPQSAKEAERRRQQRWEPWPHTVGQSRFIPEVDYPPEGSHTLDLRRYPAQAR